MPPKPRTAYLRCIHSSSGCAGGHRSLRCGRGHTFAEPRYQVRQQIAPSTYPSPRPSHIREGIARRHRWLMSRSTQEVQIAQCSAVAAPGRLGLSCTTPNIPHIQQVYKRLRRRGRSCHSLWTLPPATKEQSRQIPLTTVPPCWRQRSRPTTRAASGGYAKKICRRSRHGVAGLLVSRQSRHHVGKRAKPSLRFWPRPGLGCA